MKFSSGKSIIFATIASLALSAPVTYDTNSTAELQSPSSQEILGWSHATFPTIYQTCNETNARMLNAAFKDTAEITAYGKDRLLNYGVDDVYYKRWFGNGSIFTVMGVFEQLMEASKGAMLMRCDDIDGLCAANPNYYAGHHRQSAPVETVICDYFYTSKKPLSTICFEGTIVDVGPKHYAGIDMLHRYLHVPTMSMDGYVGEYAETLEEVVDYAQNNATYAVRNTDNYLYYLADVYSASVIPGGCLGNL
ncbi:BCN_G0047470.mRNA.1.CDS.1 [Saccharomyces cerevisiae]|nr:BCN_G0047470.mRNA.1.CDS.1 [Saccharomyces cerevisiae]CAI4762745.1 BCE_3a_G0047540.mRNA.1.CDS.1 [Saccharomyces cerevisiae]CAI7317741.1 BCN_G0047470.mRNA.1.CDS.1 [Saccharomyces cerevisiae]CAI7322193.1 BCE_3a_G0047540.mRNA.1.CDS.1 [Saccharomyces cerevisiae]